VGTGHDHEEMQGAAAALEALPSLSSLELRAPCTAPVIEALAAAKALRRLHLLVLRLTPDGSGALAQHQAVFAKVHQLATLE
jgi:hypothetical protein